MFAFWDKHTEVDAIGAARCPLPFDLLKKEKLLSKYVQPFEKVVKKLSAIKETCPDDRKTLKTYFGQYTACLFGKKTALVRIRLFFVSATDCS